MDFEFLESVEFCKRRYNNFSTLVIVPILVLIIIVLILSLFGVREITIKAIGEVVPEQPIERIQSTSNNTIKINNLKENMKVSKGDVLIIYENEQISLQKEKLQRQIDMLKNQEHAVMLLKKALKDPSLVIDDDEFGYSSILTDFRSRIALLKKKSHETSGQAAASEKMRQFISQQINEVEAMQRDYSQLRKAVADGSELSSGNIFASKYEWYKSQLCETSEAGEKQIARKELMKRNILLEIDNSLQRLDENLSKLKEFQTVTPPISIDNIDNTTEDISLIHAKYEADVSKEILTIRNNLFQANIDLMIIQGDLEKNKIMSKSDGIVHLRPEIEKSNFIPIGTVIAELYPQMSADTKYNIVVSISAKDILTIREGQEIKLRNQSNSSETLPVTGIIYFIASSPTRTEKGNFYEVRARIKFPLKRIDRIKYGLQGEVVIITGHKTFFEYYTGLILHS